MNIKATKKKTRVSSAPARVVQPSEARVAFQEVAPELQRLPADALLTVNVDIPRAVSVILGAEPHIRAFEPVIKERLPKHELAAIQRLRSYALAALYAHLQTQPAPKRMDLSHLIEEAGALKRALVVAAEALAYAELVDGAKLAEIKAGTGQLDMAADLVALAALFDASWEDVATKTAISREQVERASALGTELMVALGARDHSENRVRPETAEQRTRAFTLMMRAYDSARQALTYLRWNEDDAELTAPSLYAKSRRRPAPASDEASVEPAPALPAIAPAS